MGSKITFEQKGNFHKLDNFFQKSLHKIDLSVLDSYGRKGVEALQMHTPIDSGETALQWGYTVEYTESGAVLTFTNDHIVKYCNVAILLQYGHMTKNGVFVEGIDYINPALRPIFEEICNKLGRELEKT